MSSALLFALTLALPSCPTPDPCQATARAALAGHYGKLAPWQVAGYTLILDRKPIAQGHLLLTHYYPWEPDGKIDCRGRLCTLRTAACNRLPQGTFIWTDAEGLREVRDTGSHRNDTVAARAGKLWADYWWPKWRAQPKDVHYVAVR